VLARIGLDRFRWDECDVSGAARVQGYSTPRRLVGLERVRHRLRRRRVGWRRQRRHGRRRYGRGLGSWVLPHIHGLPGRPRRRPVESILRRSTTVASVPFARASSGYSACTKEPRSCIAQRPAERRAICALATGSGMAEGDQSLVSRDREPAVDLSPTLHRFGVPEPASAHHGLVQHATWAARILPSICRPARRQV